MANKKDQTAQEVPKTVGRWNWKSQSSLPTLPHPSLPLLKMLSPFVEPSKTGV